MSIAPWLFGNGNGHDKYQQAIDLADEVTLMMRSRNLQRDPFKPVLADLLFKDHDPALVADAYEISQESRIYKGAEH